jgi:hypothetical protein
MLWRGYWSFRAGPELVVSRHDLRFLSWTRASLQSFLAMSGGNVLHLEQHARHKRLALFPPDAELFLEWLGVGAQRPPRKFPHLVSIALWLMWLAGVGILGAVMTGERFFPLAVGIPVVMVLAIGSLATLWVRIRQVRPDILKDEFVAEVQEQFRFLNDFGFRDVRVRYLPWSVVVVFGAPDRLVRLGLNRRQQRLALEIERRGGRPQNMRDLLLNSGHPDPDRVTRFQGADGPMRAALAANAHALRLWGRAFLIDGANS